jgi:hypothetical protein
MALLDTLLRVTKIATQIANPELLRETTKANVEALELSRDNVTLQRRVNELEQQLREVSDRRSLAETVYRLEDFVFRDGDPNPCCSGCWDTKERLIHTVPAPSLFPICPACKTIILHSPPTAPSRNAPGAVAAI